MQITVSSSLEGRDLALLKSVINILHPGDTDAVATHWQYKETANHQIYIAQDFHNHGCEYYALLKAEEKRINIGSSINPKILRQLFGQLAEGKLSSKFETESHFAVGYSVKTQDPQQLVAQLYQYMSSQALLSMNIDCASGVGLIIDKAKDRVYSTEPLEQALAEKVLADNNVAISLNESDIKVDRNNYSYQIPAKHFLWQLGLIIDENLLLPDFHQNTVAFRQVTWPDYGCLPFKNAFVSLSALVWRRAETFESLKTREQFNEKEIISFLNASCLSACTIVNRSSKDIKVTLNKVSADKNSFLGRLKQKLFGKNS